ncbi:MAG TPA: NAD(P)/FAD-dependent oxidoreductase [Streptosporangiaceae bacterium]|nr:NAD(P)/FAD-dependent oxidoreductase [Streptosporangiaceae bacterium]
MSPTSSAGTLGRDDVPDQHSYDAIIVGAGLSGLYQLYRLRQLGLRARVIEAAGSVGGTWYWNRYPGARCDVQSMSYSYSFSPELEQDWTWTEKYPTQPEILRYINHVADRFELWPDMTFSTRVTKAHFDEQTKRWTVTTDAGGELDTQFLIMATGCLSAAKLPEIPGLERYLGRKHQTANWGKEEARFDGLRVGVIGTGSSGIQSIPIIAEQAADLTVFQRTPNFSMPAGNRQLSADEVAGMKATYPDWRALQRSSRAGIPGPESMDSAVAATPGERAAKYEAAWVRGELTALVSTYIDILIDPAANETAAEFVRDKIRATVRDQKVAETLCPRTFPVGTKRMCLDTGYYETYNRPNVHLVDLRETPLVEFTPTGIRTAAAEHELDAIVFATGFDAMTGALTAIDIRGRNGVDLASQWSAGPRNYLGLAMAGFPHLFTITGPLSPSVLSNMVVSIEQHVDFITECMTYMREHGYEVIEATQAAQDEWVQHVADVGAFTLFPQAESWYTGANVPGKPRVFMPYIGGVGEFRVKCNAVAASGYEGFSMSKAGTPAVA